LGQISRAWPLLPSPGLRPAAAMAPSTRVVILGATLVQASILVASAGEHSTSLAMNIRQAQLKSQMQQKWGWSDLEDLQKQVKDGVNEHTHGWTDGIASYRESVNQYTDALKDASFTKAVQALGVCKYLPKAEEQSSDDIEEVLPSELSGVEETEADDGNACEAVADQVTAEELKGQLEQGNLGGEIMDKFMKLIVQRSSAALCEGENGIKSWMDKNAHLKTTDPEEYKEQLKKQLKGRLNPVMSEYTSQFCPESESEGTRLFSQGRLAAIGLGGQGSMVLIAVCAVMMASIAGLMIRRMAYQPRAQDLEACAEEQVLE